jgi:hypothetical protein
MTTYEDDTEETAHQLDPCPYCDGFTPDDDRPDLTDHLRQRHPECSELENDPVVADARKVILQIASDIACDVVPYTDNFAELHDHIDANDYLVGTVVYADPEAWESYVDYCNAVTVTVDAWMGRGVHCYLLTVARGAFGFYGHCGQQGVDTDAGIGPPVCAYCGRHLTPTQES